MAYALGNVLNQEALQIWVWEEDGAYTAKCLDIPGCVTQGDTREETLANIEDAIALCLEVIKEDCAKPQDPNSVEVEMIQRPISDFSKPINFSHAMSASVLPTANGRDMSKAFCSKGWVQRRQSGSHIILTKSGLPTVWSIPDHKEVRMGTLKQLIRLAGWTDEEYREIFNNR